MENTKVVEKISRNVEASSDVQILNVKFVDDDTVYLFCYDDLDYLKYLNQEVIITIREEVFNSSIRQFINTMAEVDKVSVIEADGDYKLFVEDPNNTESNVVFKDLVVGDITMNAVMYCCGHIYESSAKATWATLTVLDKHRRSAKLRLFDPERRTHEFAGKYIQADIKITKFGLSTQEVRPLSLSPLSANPEIAVSMNYLKKAISGDKELMDFEASNNLFEKLASYYNPNNEDNYEAGYALIELAREVAMIRALINITRDLDIQLMVRAAIVSRVYAKTDSPKQPLSKSMQTMLLFLRSPMARDKKLMSLIDKDCEYVLPERAMLESIQKSIGVLSKAVKTYEFTQSSDKIWG